MKLRLQTLALILALPLVIVGVGCGRLQAKQSFKDGNKAYKEENFKKAIEAYQKAIEADPDMAEAYFYLASSYQALYRPGKDTPENKQLLEKAIESYKKSLEVNSGKTDNLRKVKINTLGALTAIYSDEVMHARLALSCEALRPEQQQCIFHCVKSVSRPAMKTPSRRSKNSPHE